MASWSTLGQQIRFEVEVEELELSLSKAEVPTSDSIVQVSAVSFYPELCTRLLNALLQSEPQLSFVGAKP